MIDEMPFPPFEKDVDHSGLVFLAICSIRRLLNRIHSALYTAIQPEPFGNSSTTSLSDSPLSPGSITSNTSDGVCTELSRQLDAWYVSLPDSIKPNMEQAVPNSLSEGWMRLRYWSAKHIIHRPYILQAASTNYAMPLSSHLLQRCAICITSCRQYLSLAVAMLMQRSQYTWMTMQG